MTQGKHYSNGVALILGGSGGIGAACAKGLADDGNNVAISYHANQSAAQSVLGAISEVNATSHQLDVGNREQCIATIKDVIKEHGRINALVYAIGSSIAQPLVAEISQQQWAEVMQNDLQGFMNIIQPIVKHMREFGGGSLVHVSSAGLGRTPVRDSLSVAPKAAIDALLKTIATEEGSFGIRANSVGVGVVEAGIFKRLEAEGVFDDEWKALVKGALPLRSFGQAEDIAAAVTFFASNRSKYITGQTLFVDGGYSA